jgi:hypothetical protein
MTDSAYTTALEHFVRRDFIEWQGLPENCWITEAQTALKLSEAYGVGRLGREYTPAFFRTRQLEGYINFVRAWYRDEKLVLLDGEYPTLPVELSALLESYGAPEIRLDYHQDVVKIKAGALVYPQRGITFFLNANAQMLARVAVYAVTSLEHYLAHLSFEEKAREFKLD